MLKKLIELIGITIGLWIISVFIIPVTGFSNPLYNSVVTLSTKTKVPYFCSLIFFKGDVGDTFVSAKWLRGACLSDYAIRSEDINFCQKQSLGDNVYDYPVKIGCLRGLARKLHKPELCNEIIRSGPDSKWDADLQETCKLESR